MSVKSEHRIGVRGVPTLDVIPLVRKVLSKNGESWRNIDELFQKRPRRWRSDLVVHHGTFEDQCFGQLRASGWSTLALPS